MSIVQGFYILEGGNNPFGAASAEAFAIIKTQALRFCAIDCVIRQYDDPSGSIAERNRKCVIVAARNKSDLDALDFGRAAKLVARRSRVVPMPHFIEGAAIDFATVVCRGGMTIREDLNGGFSTYRPLVQDGQVFHENAKRTPAGDLVDLKRRDLTLPAGM